LKICLISVKAEVVWSWFCHSFLIMQFLKTILYLHH